MKFTRVACALAVVLVMSAGGLLWAQEQTGSIQGVVKDSSGAVLPGVTVEARNADGRSQTAVTNDNGVYRFPALPPGVWAVTATLQGFTPAKVENAAIELGKLLSIDLTLSVGGVTESVQVTGESPLIDTKQNASYATIRQDTIERMPKGRDFTSILKTAPGSQAESKAGGEAQIDGASGSENRFVVDGMDTTSLQTGVSGKTMLLDFIQEVQVKSSGYNAEFGGALGGVVSAITKSGTNTLRGQLGAYLQSSKFYGAKRNSPGFDAYNSNIAIPSQVFPDNDWLYYSPVVDIGGPILKDRLWFYVGSAFTRNQYQKDVTFYGDPKRVQRHFDWWSNAYYANYNISTQVTNNLRVKLSASNQRNSNRKTAPGSVAENYVFPDGTKATTQYTTATFDKLADGSINQSAFDSRWIKQGNNSSNDVYSGNVDWVLTPTFFVNASGGYYRANNTTPPEFRGDSIRHIFDQANYDSWMIAQGFETVPASYQQPAGYSDTISSSGTVRNIYDRAFFNGNLTYFLNFGGQHTLKAGMRFERFGNDALIGNAKPNVNLVWGNTYTNQDTGQVFKGKYGYYIVTQTGTIGKVHSNNYSFWLQDSWNVNSRLTINAGVRAENETVPSYKKAADAVTIKFGFKDKIAPRLGFAYDVKGDGKWKAYGSYGHFFDITKLEMPRGSFGGDHWIAYYWTLDTYDFSSINCGEGTTGCPGTFISQIDYRRSSNQYDAVLSKYFGRDMTGVDPNMKPVQGRELTAGIDHELNPTTSLKLRYVHKWLVRTIEDLGTFINGEEVYLIGNPGEAYGRIMEPLYPDFPTPKPVRKYDSIELRLTRRLSNRWAGDVSYQWSRLKGNYSGLASADEGNRAAGGRTSPNVNRYFDYTIQNYDKNAKSVIGPLPTDRPHVVKVQGSYDAPWGTQIGAFWSIMSGTPISTVIRYSGYPVFVNGRGDLGRSPMLSQLDLQAVQEFRLGRYRLALMANVDNVLDQKTWTNYFSPNLYGPQPYRESITLQMPPVKGDNTTAAVLYQPYNPDAIAAWYRGKGATLRDNVLFKTPGYFQDRRQIRLSAKITF